MSIKLGYNPARQCTVTRKTVFIQDFVFCNSCHSIKTTPKGRKFLYQYFVKEKGESNKIQQIPHEFCSIRCIRYYLEMMSKGFSAHNLTSETKINSAKDAHPKKLNLNVMQKQLASLEKNLGGVDLTLLKPRPLKKSAWNMLPNYVDVA